MIHLMNNTGSNQTERGSDMENYETRIQSAAVQFATDHGPLSAARKGDPKARAKVADQLANVLAEQGLIVVEKLYQLIPIVMKNGIWNKQRSVRLTHLMCHRGHRKPLSSCGENSVPVIALRKQHEPP